MSLTTTLTDVNDQVHDRLVQTVKDVKKPVVDATRSAVSTVDDNAPVQFKNLPGYDLLSEVPAQVANSFDFSIKVIDAQHDYTTKLIESLPGEKSAKDKAHTAKSKAKSATNNAAHG